MTRAQTIPEHVLARCHAQRDRPFPPTRGITPAAGQAMRTTAGFDIYVPEARIPVRRDALHLTGARLPDDRYLRTSTRGCPWPPARPSRSGSACRPRSPSGRVSTRLPRQDLATLDHPLRRPGHHRRRPGWNTDESLDYHHVPAGAVMRTVPAPPDACCRRCSSLCPGRTWFLADPHATDLRHRRTPDRLTTPTSAAGLLVGEGSLTVDPVVSGPRSRTADWDTRRLR